MKKDYTKFHVPAAVIFNMVFLIITFSCDNPLILISIFTLYFLIFFSLEKINEFNKGLIYFIPFAIITMLINIIFVSKGNTTLFVLLGKEFTLESLIYAFILSFKLLMVIYSFIIFSLMLDSDKTVAYFSRVMPKTTITMMISMKLFPSMKEKLRNLKIVYSIRGVDFENKNIKNYIKNNIPVLSILLEDSLEASFDIGEAAYVRGFLSGKRTVYEKDKFKRSDYIITILSSILLLTFVIVHISGKDSFDIYSKGINSAAFLNIPILIIICIIFINTIALISILKKSY